MDLVLLYLKKNTKMTFQHYLTCTQIYRGYLSTVVSFILDQVMYNHLHKLLCKVWASERVIYIPIRSNTRIVNRVKPSKCIHIIDFVFYAAYGKLQTFYTWYYFKILIEVSYFNLYRKSIVDFLKNLTRTIVIPTHF